MKLRRAVTHLAVASLTFVILVITVDRPALAQFGDLLDKAKQAAESARKAGETVREALGSGTGAPVSPAKGGMHPQRHLPGKAAAIRTRPVSGKRAWSGGTTRATVAWT